MHGPSTFGWPHISQTNPFCNRRHRSQGDSGDNLDRVCPFHAYAELLTAPLFQRGPSEIVLVYIKMKFIAVHVKTYLQMIMHLNMFFNVLGMCLLLFHQRPSPYQILHGSSGSCEGYPRRGEDPGWW